MVPWLANCAVTTRRELEIMKMKRSEKLQQRLTEIEGPAVATFQKALDAVRPILKKGAYTAADVESLAALNDRAIELTKVAGEMGRKAAARIAADVREIVKTASAMQPIEVAGSTLVAPAIANPDVRRRLLEQADALNASALAYL